MPNFLPVLFIVSLLVAFTSEGRSQSATSSKDPAQWALIYSDNLEKNRRALSQYTGQFKIAVTAGTELLFVDILEATRESDGALQTVRMEKDLKVKEHR